MEILFRGRDKLGSFNSNAIIFPIVYLSINMNILFLTHFLNSLLMIAMPIGLAIYLTRKFHLGARLWWIGAATFVLSQVGHIPFNAIIQPLFNRSEIVAMQPAIQRLIMAIFLGLSAGLFEELSRYGMFRWWAKDAHAWRKGILTGAGHGGIEAIIFGALALYAFIQLMALRDVDLSSRFPADQLALAEQQVRGYWSMAWPASLLGALERAFTIPIHICMAVLVLQTFVRRQWFWVWLAVLFHALIDATAVMVPYYLPGAWVELFVIFFGLVSIALIFLLRQPEPVEEIVVEETSAKPLPPVAINPVDESLNSLDSTKFN